MSNFSQVLTDIVDKNALTKGKLAKKSHLRKKQLSQILMGKKRFISNGDFKRLARAVTTDELDQAHLVAARMMDVCNGPGKELVSLHVKGDQANDAK
jgi:hypothetical protein